MNAKDRFGMKDEAKFKMGKKLEDDCTFKGKVEWVLKGPDGKVKARGGGKLPNTVTVAWDEMVASQLIAAPVTAKPTHMAVGTTTGGKTTASTALEAIIGASRTVLDSTTQGAGAADNDIIYVCTLGAGVGTGDIKEIGLYNADADAALVAWKDGGDVGTITKGAADSLEITWTVQCGAS